jgi:UDP-N-acetylmuramoyl-L-alanyl-D-glutamate--2,6-diaminopimelate ligase
MERLKQLLASVLPRSAYRAILAPYHWCWAAGSALRYGFPARKLTIIGVTGTKGKSSVSETLFAILTAAGHKTAVAGTIRFAIGDESRPNKYKMTVPGRGFLQKFLAEAVRKGATHAVLELTSEGALQYRHAFLSMDALVFTNLQKEHIESHGSFAKYFRAKFRIAEALAKSPKRPRAIVANAESPGASAFLAVPVEDRIPFRYADAAHPKLGVDGVSFTYDGTEYSFPQPGRFSILNALAAVKTARWLGIDAGTVKGALAGVARIPGRAERVEAGQEFIAVVDYAHTPDSLKALYDAYAGRRRVCVLGNTGGGRDTWKRPEMGRIADEHCDEVILTDEDPYDEDPAAIVAMMAKGMKRAPRIVMDRRAAVREALSLARPGDAVLVTGKGTDPYIMRAQGEREPWSDAQVVREELERLVSSGHA